MVRCKRNKPVRESVLRRIRSNIQNELNVISMAWWYVTMTRNNQAFILCWVTISNFYIQKHSWEGIEILRHREQQFKIKTFV